jgi:hypothetical protein
MNYKPSLLSRATAGLVLLAITNSYTLKNRNLSKEKKLLSQPTSMRIACIHKTGYKGDKKSSIFLVHCME